jgi:hypothetical protein
MKERLSIPAAHSSRQFTAAHAITVVKRLPPSELHKFKRQFLEWQKQNREEAMLLQAAQARLPATTERRLKQLIAKSERGTLTPKELEEYRDLGKQTEQLNVKRVEALAELAKRRKKPVRVIMNEIGWESGENGASSHPSRRTAARA